MSVRLTGIEKRFGAVHALRGVDLAVRPGTVHALLGANGSGKSTLSKCVCGAYRPDAGRMLIGDTETGGFASPVEAARAGVRVVHQDAPMIDTLSVAENLALTHGYPTGRGARVRWRALRRRTAEALDRFGVDVDPSVPAGALGPARRAMVTLALALQGDLDEVGLLVLDEVTASIPEDEAEEFLLRVRELPALGVPVLMVTHRLKEVKRFADSTTVLSDGAVVHDGSVADLTIAEMVGFMTATRTGVDAAQLDPLEAVDLDGLWSAPERRSSGPLLQLEDLDGAQLDGLSLTVAAGEIVGVAGLPESGIEELPRILSGAVARRGGRVVIDGHSPARTTPREMLAAGVATVPRDRRREGGVMSLGTGENITLPEARRFWHRRAAERATVRRFVDAFEIRPGRPEALLGTLSGGNQQKAVISKCLLTGPRVLVLDDPTAGVDPGARRQIYRILRTAANAGLGVLLFSTEPEQLALQCDRVLVLRAGRVVMELTRSELDPTTIDQRVLTLSSQ